MATETEQLVVSLEARITQFEKAFQRATRTADSQFSAVERRARQSADRLDNLMSSTALSVNRALGAIGVGISFAEIQKFADAWTTAGNKIKAAATATGVQVRSLDELKAGANDARTSLEAYVDLYARLTRASAGIAKNEGEIAQATNILAKSFKASGATAAEAAAGALQVGQALGSGVLQGDELRSIKENAQPIAQAIADAFGVPIGALKTLGEQGKLTSDKVFGAILAAGPKVEAQFKATTATIGDSFTGLENNVTAYVGKIAEASGVSAAFRSVVDGLAGNIGAVANGAAAAAAVLLSSFVPALVRSAAATALMVATNPFLALAVAVGGAAFALTAFGDQLHPIPGDLASVQDYAAVAWDEIKEGATVAADTISSAFQTVVDFIGNALGSIGTSWADVGTVIKGVANFIINAMVTAYDLIVATWSKLPPAIADAAISATNGMLAKVENALNGVIEMVNTAVEAINSVGSNVGVELGKIGTVDLGRITNTYAGAGEAAGKAYTDALSNMTRDRVGEALGALNKAGTDATEAWRTRANARAGQRQTEKTTAKTSADASASAPLTAGKGMPVELVKEYGDTQKRIAALQTEMAIRRSIPGSIEQQEAALERVKVAQQLVDEAVKEGVVMTDEVKTKIGTLADAYSRASQEAKALATSQQEAAQNAKDLENASKDVFKGFISDLRAGKSGTDALRNALVKIGDKMVDFALDQAWQGMMGAGGKGVFQQAANIFNPTKEKPVYAPGGAADTMRGVNFNGGITAPTATVTANTVTVTGSIPGATPGTPTAAPTNVLEAASKGKPVVAPLTSAALPSENEASLKALTSGAIPAGAYDKSIPASIRTNNPGAMWYADWQKKYGVVGKQSLNDGLGQNNNAAMFPTQEAGAAAQFELLQKYGSRGWDLRKGITTWSGGNSSDQYVGSVAGKLGMSPDAKLSDLMGDQTQATKLAQYMAQQEAGRTYPMTDKQWGSAWNLYRSKNGGPQQDPQQATQPTQQTTQAQQPAQQEAPLAEQQRQQLEQAQQAQQQYAQSLQQTQQATAQATPQLGNLSSGIGGLASPIASVVPGLGSFGKSIVGLAGQLVGSLGGGAKAGGGLLSLFGFAEGGIIDVRRHAPHFAGGGAISGPGTGTSDSILANVSNGEFVVNAASTAKHRGALEAINSGKAPKFATGGIVNSSAFTSSTNNTINVTAQSTGNARQDQAFGNMIAGKVAAATSPKQDSFRRSDGQQSAAAAAAANRYSGRNN